MSRITKAELLAMANSPNADDRKRAFALFKAWIKAAPTLPFQDQITTTERYLLTQVFASKGMKVESLTPARPGPAPARPSGPSIRRPPRI